jgi:hypothetical protein
MNQKGCVRKRWLAVLVYCLAPGATECPQEPVRSLFPAKTSNRGLPNTKLLLLSLRYYVYTNKHYYQGIS